jgi:hypothetical protein
MAEAQLACKGGVGNAALLHRSEATVQKGSRAHAGDGGRAPLRGWPPDQESLWPATCEPETALSVLSQHALWLLVPAAGFSLVGSSLRGGTS